MIVRARWGLSPLLAILLVGLPFEATAQINDIVCTVNGQGRNAVMGEEAWYEPGGSIPEGYTIATNTWEWRQRYQDDCLTPWSAPSDPGAGSPFSHTHQTPGTVRFRLTVDYSIMEEGKPPLPPSVVEKDFEIAPADRVEVLYGLGVPAQFGDPIMLTLQMYAGSRVVGPYTAGLAQKLITDRWLMSSPPVMERVPDETIWHPAPGLPNTDFFQFGSHIYDLGYHSGSWPWALIPVNAGYHTYTENVRLVIGDANGHDLILPLGSVRLAWVKVDANRWKIELASP